MRLDLVGSTNPSIVGARKESDLLSLAIIFNIMFALANLILAGRPCLAV